MSPQPIITLTDVSVNGHNGREEILYSEDFDAIQEYLQFTSSPMVALSPSFFRQQSGSTPSSLFTNNLQSADGPFGGNLQSWKPPIGNSVVKPAAFQEHKSLCNENDTRRQQTQISATSNEV